jgi:hypothetical protein
MKRAPRSRQRHDLYAKYHDYDSEISDLLGECGFKAMKQLLIEQGTPADPAYRAADRLIQKMRKAQVIEWCPGLGWIIGDASK